MVDLHLWPFFERILLLKGTHDIEVISKDAFPNLTKYTETMLELPCVKSILINLEKAKVFLDGYKEGKFPAEAWDSSWTEFVLPSWWHFHCHHQGHNSVTASCLVHSFMSLGHWELFFFFLLDISQRNTWHCLILAFSISFPSLTRENTCI